MCLFHFISISASGMADCSYCFIFMYRYIHIIYIICKNRNSDVPGETLCHKFAKWLKQFVSTCRSVCAFDIITHIVTYSFYHYTYEKLFDTRSSRQHLTDKPTLSDQTTPLSQHANNRRRRPEALKLRASLQRKERCEDKHATRRNYP